MIKKGLNPRLAEVGKIKIGGKGELRKKKDNSGSYRLPIKYNHFVVTTTERDKETGNLKPNIEIMDKLGKNPKEIPIRLVFDDIDINFFTSFALYQGKKLFCSGDGETATRRQKDDTMKNIACDPEKCPFLKDEKCKVSGILSCMLACSPEFGGVYRFRTHSWNSVSNILASLHFISENTNGILQGLPLKLKMIKKTTEEHGDVNIVTIVLDGIELNKMRELASKEYTNRLQIGIDMKSIEKKAKESGFLIDKDSPEDVQEEYYPETIEPETGVNPEELKEKLTDKIESKSETTEPIKPDKKDELDIF